MTNDNSSDMKYYADFVYLNRKVKNIWRTRDDGEFVGEVDVKAGLKWCLREARGINMNIWWS